jgi:hypothetical protein
VSRHIGGTVPSFKPFKGLELLLDDGKKIRVRAVDFLVDDDPNSEPLRWRLTVLDPAYVKRIVSMGFAQLVE